LRREALPETCENWGLTRTDRLKETEMPSARYPSHELVCVKDAQLLEIQDDWCREMAKQAKHDVEEIDTRITLARRQRVVRQSPESTYALEKEIALLQRIREELESDIDGWIFSSPS
jgi:hypothetical protein